MHSLPASPPSTAPLDLSRYSEDTRRRLYDLVVATFWPTDPGPGDELPGYSPDEAGLQILFLADSWFAWWRLLELLDDPDLPPDRKRELVRITISPGIPAGVLFSEV